MNFYTEEQLSELIHIQRRNLALIRNLGMLVGVKTGNQWVYTEDEVVRFFEKYRGKDISNQDKINELI